MFFDRGGFVERQYRMLAGSSGSIAVFIFRLNVCGTPVRSA